MATTYSVKWNNSDTWKNNRIPDSLDKKQKERYVNKYIDLLKWLKWKQLNAKTTAKIHFWANRWNKRVCFLYIYIYLYLIYGFPSLWSIFLKIAIPLMLIQPPRSLKTAPFYVYDNGIYLLREYQTSQRTHCFQVT